MGLPARADRGRPGRPDTDSPRWIQEPEGAGALIAQLDESFAPKLNFGDNGAIYAMVGGVVFQCH